MSFFVPLSFLSLSRASIKARCDAMMSLCFALGAAPAVELFCSDAMYCYQERVTGHLAGEIRQSEQDHRRGGREYIIYPRRLFLSAALCATLTRGTKIFIGSVNIMQSVVSSDERDGRPERVFAELQRGGESRVLVVK